MSCLSPIQILDPYSRMHPEETKHFREVPCNKCVECRKKIRGQWQFRIEIESKHNAYSFFVTLTYHDSLLPNPFWVDRPDGTGYLQGSLDYRDFQLFMKRYRKLINKKYGIFYGKGKNRKQLYSPDCRYVVKGEYGSSEEDSTHRPHFHIQLFTNCKQMADNIYSDMETCWQNGIVDIDRTTPANIGYITKDMMKDSDPNNEHVYIDGKYIVDWCDEMGLPRPVSHYSTGNGKYIGYQYEELGKSYHTSNISKNNCVTIASNNQKVAIPKIYRTKWYGKRKANIWSYLLDLKRKSEDDSYEKALEEIKSEFNLTDSKRDTEQLFRIYFERYDPERLSQVSFASSKAKTPTTNKYKYRKSLRYSHYLQGCTCGNCET